jgi:hypothetical protein
VDEDIVLDVGVPLVLVDDNNNTGDADDADDGSANIGNSDKDNAEVPETQFGYEDWINDAATDEVNEEEQVMVDEVAELIRKKVQMKIEPMNKAVVRTNVYKNEIDLLRCKNVVTLRKLKHGREAHSNEFLKKKLCERLVAMEENGIVSKENVEESQRLQGNRYWKRYLLNR